MSEGRTLVYILRRDLRTSDNPIFHYLASSPGHGFTHLLPLYVFPSHQVEVSGFVEEGQQSPYPEARSVVGKYWRCGPHRAKFLAQSVWDLKQNLQDLNSGLVVRVGKTADVLKHFIANLDGDKHKVGAVLMHEEPSPEEITEQDEIAGVCSENDVDFRLWTDEKYFIDDRDTGLERPALLPDVYTAYRKSQEPLRQKPRRSLPRPERSSLPPMLDNTDIPPQASPFVAVETLDDLLARILQPVQNILSNPQPLPENAESSHPFRGGETSGLSRLHQLVKNGDMSTYHETRNGLQGTRFSTKLSAYLSLGCITARQVHEELLKLEDGTDPNYNDSVGYGQGENLGTQGIRHELLWRDYMRLCTRKFGRRLFYLSGIRKNADYKSKWVTPDKNKARPEQEPNPDKVAVKLQRFIEGITGMGLIDASQREIYHTGYTSNRARQNVASFLSKHLGIDWRYGAEWYECMLVDYDVSSNWANWQYVSGVGNDPRGDTRTLNPVKQAFDYDTNGSFVRTWMPELEGLEDFQNLFQVCTTDPKILRSQGLIDNIMVTDPLKRIEFMVVDKLKDPNKKRFRYPRYLNGPQNGRTYGRRGYGKGVVRRNDNEGESTASTHGESEPWSQNPDNNTGIAPMYMVPQNAHHQVRPQSVPLFGLWNAPQTRPQSAFQEAPWDEQEVEYGADAHEHLLSELQEEPEEEPYGAHRDMFQAAAQSAPPFVPQATPPIWSQVAARSGMPSTPGSPYHGAPQMPPQEAPSRIIPPIATPNPEARPYVPPSIRQGGFIAGGGNQNIPGGHGGGPRGSPSHIPNSGPSSTNWRAGRSGGEHSDASTYVGRGGFGRRGQDSGSMVTDNTQYVPVPVPVSELGPSIPQGHIPPPSQPQTHSPSTMPPPPPPQYMMAPHPDHMLPASFHPQHLAGPPPFPPPPHMTAPFFHLGPMPPPHPMSQPLPHMLPQSVGPPIPVSAPESTVHPQV